MDLLASVYGLLAVTLPSRPGQPRLRRGAPLTAHYQAVAVVASRRVANQEGQSELERFFHFRDGSSASIPNQWRRTESFVAIAAAVTVFASSDVSYLTSQNPGPTTPIVVSSYQTKPEYAPAARVEALELDYGVEVVLTPKPDRVALEQIAKGERLREIQVVASARRATLARAQQEAAAVLAGEWQPWLAGSASGGQAMSSSSWIVPTTGAFTSGFGPRWGTYHRGVDIANAIGTPIYAAASGTVVEAGPVQGFGLWVKIRHDDGSFTVYGHIYDFFVSKGERVPAGLQIARMGNRGDSTGSHLHFEVIDGVQVDPQKWLARRGVRLA